MSNLAVDHVTVVLPDRTQPDRAVVVEDGKIAGVCRSEELRAVDAEQAVDAQRGYLLPGMIDLHIHGTHEFLVDNGPADLAELCRVLPRYGVTGLLPTVCPVPKGEDARRLALLAEVRVEGAAILGFHLEGPFLKLTGALPPEALGRADPERVEALIEAARPYAAIFSIAPDFEDIVDLLPLMTAGGKPAFITHTKADVPQTRAAIEAGARHATHFYDVFYAPEETDPGVRPCGAVEAILADPRASVDFILDGEHTDPAAVKMALQCKGPDGVSLVTDANIGAGLPPGRYQFGKEEVEFAYPGGPARMTEKARSPGVLTGSGLTMDRALRNAVELLGVNLPQAVRMISANPAKVLGLGDTKGEIAAGFDADLVLLDKDLQVQRTWVGGQCVFSRQVEVESRYKRNKDHDTI